MPVGHAARRTAGVGIQHDHPIAHVRARNVNIRPSWPPPSIPTVAPGQNHAGPRELEREDAVGLRGAERVEPSRKDGSLTASIATA